MPNTLNTDVKNNLFYALMRSANHNPHQRKSVNTQARQSTLLRKTTLTCVDSLTSSIRARLMDVFSSQDSSTIYRSFWYIHDYRPSTNKFTIEKIMKSTRQSFPSRKITRYCVVLFVFLGPIFDNRISADQWNPAKTYALIVGVLEWESDLTQFSQENRKDEALRQQLIERGTPPENITVLLDSEATLANIRASMNGVLDKSDEDSTLIIYYAGHGWKAGDDFCFANYDVRLGPSNRNTAWSMRELAAITAAQFRGKQVILWADCCYSGGMKLIAEALNRKDIPCFSLTSAGLENTSTGNWTFTQSILDGLAGEPIVDTNQDGNISLAELQSEVRNAMTHLEGQKSGFYNDGFDMDWSIGPVVGKIQAMPRAKFPIGSYVKANRRFGRVIGMIEKPDQQYQIQFYSYSDKIVSQFSESDLTPSNRTPTPSVVRVQPDCQVEWQGDWYDAKVVMAEKGRWWIRYVDYDESWNEWVGQDRIRIKNRTQDNPK